MAKAIQDIYNDANGAYRDTQVLPRWTPPDGTYVLSLQDVIERQIKGKGDQANQTGMMIVVTGKVIDGDYAGKSCVLTRAYTLSGFLSGIKALAETLGGGGVSLAEDIALLKANIGAVLVGQASSRKDDKTGKTYTDIEVIEATPPEATAAVVDDGQGPEAPTA